GVGKPVNSVVGVAVSSDGRFINPCGFGPVYFGNISVKPCSGLLGIGIFYFIAEKFTIKIRRLIDFGQPPSDIVLVIDALQTVAYLFVGKLGKFVVFVLGKEFDRVAVHLMNVLPHISDFYWILLELLFSHNAIKETIL